VRARAAFSLLLSSHPGPVVGVTLASAAYAVALGRSGNGVAAAAAAVLAGQLSVGWHNDWIDAERDARSGRRDKPVALGEIAPTSVGRAAFIALAATIPLSLLSGWRAGLVHIAAVASAWAYNAGIKATAFSFLPYAISFALLPVFLAMGAPGAPSGPWWAAVAGALLGLGAHLMNALPDLDEDRAVGVRGLPHRLGRRRALMLAGLLLFAASALLTFHHGRPSLLGLSGLVLATLGVAAALASSRRTDSRAPFGLTIVVALIDVGLLLLAGHSGR